MSYKYIYLDWSTMHNLLCMKLAFIIENSPETISVSSRSKE